MSMVSMLLLSSLHAVAGFFTFAIITAVVGVPTVLAVLLLFLIPAVACVPELDFQTELMCGMVGYTYEKIT